MIPNPLVLKRDPADEATGKLIWQAKTKAWFAYDQAKSEIEGKLSEYMDRFAKQDEEMQSRVSSGKMTKGDYIDWRKSHLMTGRRWEEMKRTIAKDLENADLIARSSVVGHMPEAYAENFNFGTYQVERSGQCDTDFTLYDRYTVEKLIESDPDLLPPPGKTTLRDIASGKLQKWQEGQIQSVTLQSILQGESVYGMARRISNELSTRGYKDCVRYARTALTGAENAGRYDSYRRAKKLGIDLTLEWMATLDGRTRHDHRLLDGQRRNVDEPFEVDGIKIFYPAQLPGESSVPQEMIWNCRCTIVAWVKGFEEDTVTSSPKMGGMSYEEWKNEHTPENKPAKPKKPKKPKPIIKDGMKIDPETGEVLEILPEVKTEERKKTDFKSDKLGQMMTEEDFKAYKALVDSSETGDILAKYADSCQGYLNTPNGGVYRSWDVVEFSYAYEKYEGIGRFDTLAHEMHHMIDAKVGRFEGISYNEIDKINDACKIGSGMRKTIREVPSTSDTFLGAIRSDVNRLKPSEADHSLYKELLATNELRNASSGVQDLLDGIFNSQDRGLAPWGHGGAYYNRAYNRRIKEFGNERAFQTVMNDLGFDASNLTKTKQLSRIYETANEAWANVGSAVICQDKSLEVWEKYMPDTVKAYKDICGIIRK